MMNSRFILILHGTLEILTLKMYKLFMVIIPPHPLFDKPFLLKVGVEVRQGFPAHLVSPL